MITIENPNLGIRPELFGAKGDGIADDTQALRDCYTYISKLKGYTNLTILLSGIYRITDTWVLGTKFVDESDIFQNTAKAPSLNQVEFNSSRRIPLISIKGTGAAGIYADFESSTPKAVIYYCIQGDTRVPQSIELYNAQIAGVGIYPKGYFSKGIPTRAITANNNLFGIVSLNNTHLTIVNCTVIGMREGIVQNYSYFSNVSKCDIRHCQRGFYSYGCGSSKFNDSTIAFTGKAVEIRSSQFGLDGIYASSCSIGLHVAAGGFNGSRIYLESSNTGESQIIIGDNPGDQYYTSGIVDNVVFTNLTVVANKPEGAGNSLVMKDNARRVIILGGALQSSDKVFTNPLNELSILGVSGTFPTRNTKKIVTL